MRGVAVWAFKRGNPFGGGFTPTPSVLKGNSLVFVLAPSVSFLPKQNVVFRVWVEGRVKINQVSEAVRPLPHYFQAIAVIQGVVLQGKPFGFHGVSV